MCLYIKRIDHKMNLVWMCQLIESALSLFDDTCRSDLKLLNCFNAISALSVSWLRAGENKISKIKVARFGPPPPDLLCSNPSSTTSLPLPLLYTSYVQSISGFYITQIDRQSTCNLWSHLFVFLSNMYRREGLISEFVLLVHLTCFI